MPATSFGSRGEAARAGHVADLRRHCHRRARRCVLLQPSARVHGRGVDRDGYRQIAHAFKVRGKGWPRSDGMDLEVLYAVAGFARSLYTHSAEC